MNPTPRTDEAVRFWKTSIGNAPKVSAEFARVLETELARSEAKVERWRAVAEDLGYAANIAYLHLRHAKDCVTKRGASECDCGMPDAALAIRQALAELTKLRQ